VKQQRRPDPSFVVSIALHVVLGAVLVRVVMDPGSMPDWLRRADAPPPAEERIEYVRVAPRNPAPAPTRGRSGGDGRPERPNVRPRPRAAAPAAVPSGIPAPGDRPSEPAGGSGEVIGEGGATRGVRPSYTDPRVWAPPGAVVAVPRTNDEVRDSSLAVAIKVYNDSVALAGLQRKPGDWTFKKDGKRYGLEQGRLVLGDLSVPLPFSLQAPPAVSERNRMAERIRAEIEQQSRRALNEDEFRTAVRRIRERKERERARGRQGEAVATSPDGRPRED